MINLLRLVFSRFRWKQHGYVYANDLDASNGYDKFKMDYFSRLSKDDRDCLDYTFNDNFLVVSSPKTRTEAHYLSHSDLVRGRIYSEDFDRVLYMYLPE